MYAVIRNPIMLVPGTFTGRVESRHRSVKAAQNAVDRANVQCRKANGAHTWLDLRVVEITSGNAEQATGRAVSV